MLTPQQKSYQMSLLLSTPYLKAKVLVRSCEQKGLFQPLRSAFGCHLRNHGQPSAGTTFSREKSCLM